MSRRPITVRCQQSRYTLGTVWLAEFRESLELGFQLVCARLSFQ